jgi:hypothetical protein
VIVQETVKMVHTSISPHTTISPGPAPFKGLKDTFTALHPTVSIPRELLFMGGIALQIIHLKDRGGVAKLVTVGGMGANSVR